MRTEYRVKGTTDDVTDCDNCPKVNLKSTVVLAILDEGGNEEGERYVGCDCAEKLTGRKASAIRREAAAADAAAKKKRDDAEYFARNILDAYVCVLEDRRELYGRFWARNRGLRRRQAQGLVTVKASERIAEDIAEARAILPDYEPEMAPHRVEVYRTPHEHRNVWAWGCKCGRGNILPDAATRAAAETAGQQGHDIMVAAGGFG